MIKMKFYTLQLGIWITYSENQTRVMMTFQSKDSKGSHVSGSKAFHDDTFLSSFWILSSLSNYPD